MPHLSIDDLNHPALQDYVGLTDVALRSRTEPEQGLYLAESEKVIRRALSAGHAPRSMLISHKHAQRSAELIALVEAGRGEVFVGDEAVLESITGFHVHRGAIASMHRPVLPRAVDLIASARRVIVLEDIVDHTNVGAIFRSVAGLGADAVLVTPRCADPLYRRSVRVSMGTVFQVPWTRIDPWPAGLAMLKEQGFVTAAMALTEDAQDLGLFCQDLPEKLAFVMGTEGEGLMSRTVEQCEVAVQIPMSAGVDSLNVASAAAVAMWAIR